KPFSYNFHTFSLSFVNLINSLTLRIGLSIVLNTFDIISHTLTVRKSSLRYFQLSDVVESINAQYSSPAFITPISSDIGVDNTRCEHGWTDTEFITPINFSDSFMIFSHFGCFLYSSRFFPTSLYSFMGISFALHNVLNASDFCIVP